MSLASWMLREKESRSDKEKREEKSKKRWGSQLVNMTYWGFLREWEYRRQLAKEEL